MPSDPTFLQRAIRLAMNGRGQVEPNPMVGCVLVKNDRVIGEGIHAHFGGPHAEPTALASCEESPAGATAYVTLEPCCHLNKKTPPCAPRLIAAKIARVVIGCRDPNPDVDGKGIAMLREAGIEVDLIPSAQLQAEANQLIAPFIARTRFGRPYVTIKVAESNDGKVAGALGARVQITNAASSAAVAMLRSRCDAIAVGTNTVLKDDPLLTARVPRPGAARSDQASHNAHRDEDASPIANLSPRRLLRIVLSNTLKLPLENRLVNTARDPNSPVIVYSNERAVGEQPEDVDALRSAGVEIVPLPATEVPERGIARFSFVDVLRDLHARGVTHLLVEPGPTLARAMLSRNQADRAWVIRSRNPISAEDAPRATKVDFEKAGELDLDGDALIESFNPRSEVFFAATPSADFVLTRSGA